VKSFLTGPLFGFLGRVSHYPLLSRKRPTVLLPGTLRLHYHHHGYERAGNPMRHQEAAHARNWRGRGTGTAPRHFERVAYARPPAPLSSVAGPPARELPATAPRTSEKLARAAPADWEPVCLDDAEVKLPLTIVLDRDVAERLSTRAIREGKNLKTLVAEILEAAVHCGC